MKRTGRCSDKRNDEIGTTGSQRERGGNGEDGGISVGQGLSEK